MDPVFKVRSDTDPVLKKGLNPDPVSKISSDLDPVFRNRSDQDLIFKISSDPDPVLKYRRIRYKIRSDPDLVLKKVLPGSSYQNIVGSGSVIEKKSDPDPVFI